ncbi:MAG: InlB B-repeat-containing protein [Erysipelotrichales bacterium]
MKKKLFKIMAMIMIVFFISVPDKGIGALGINNTINAKGPYATTFDETAFDIDKTSTPGVWTLNEFISTEPNVDIYIPSYVVDNGVSYKINILEIRPLIGQNQRSFKMEAIKDPNNPNSPIRKISVDATSLDYSVMDTTILTHLDLSGLDTSEVVNMSRFLTHNFGLEEAIFSDFDTSSVEDFSEFSVMNPKLKELDLSSFDTSKAEYMDYMFNGCISLTKLDLSNFTVGDNVGTYIMFNENYSLNTIKIGKNFQFNENHSLPDTIAPDNTSEWYLDNGVLMYETTADFTNNYKGKVPGTYTRLKSKIKVDFVIDDKKIGTQAWLNDSYPTINAPSKEGHSFKGWNTKADGTGTYIDTNIDKVTSPITLYAIYAINEYTVTFDNNGLITTSKVEYNKKIAQNNIPTPASKNGFTFVGWQVKDKTIFFDPKNDTVKHDLYVSAVYKKDDKKNDDNKKDNNNIPKTGQDNTMISITVGLLIISSGMIYLRKRMN